MKDKTNKENIKSSKPNTKTSKTSKAKPISTNKNADSKVSIESDIKEKLAESQEKYVRISAEFDNYRKRTLKEKMDLTKNAGEAILLNILPVMDDFERALQVMESASDCKSTKDGIDLIYGKFTEFLKTNGIKEIEALNKKFDTDLHEALTKIPAPKKNLKSKVLDVVQKGYYLNDKVIRFSKVVVGE